MRKWLFVFGLLMLPIAVATTVHALKPQSLYLANDDESELVLSNRDINRLFVQNDPITRIHAPRHRVVAHNDPSGSIYLTVLGKTSFTAFVTTQKERHFSVLIIPKNVPGATVRLVPTTPVKKTNSRRSRHHARGLSASPYETALVHVLKEVMHHRTPPGFSPIPAAAFSSMKLSAPNTLTGRLGLPEKVVAGFKSDRWMVRVVQVTNRSSHTLRLRANDFYAAGVRAVAIAQETLKPHQSTQVYEVINRV